MSKFENLKKSLESLTVKNALLVKNLIQLNQEKGELLFSFETTKRGELNLFYKSTHPFYLHDQKGAIISETDWIQSLPPQRKVTFIFGTGLGYSYLLLKKWLTKRSDAHLVFVEPHLGVLFHLFQTELGVQMAQDPKVHFYTFGEKHELNYLIQYLATYFSHYTINVSALPSYVKAYPSLCEHFIKELTLGHMLVSARATESSTSFPHAMKNALYKAPHLSGNVNANQLNKQFNQMPCIIVGAGPSLKKNQDVFKNLRQKALVLAGSSAIPATNYLGIEPHFGTYYDPYQRVHERFIKTTSFEMPSFHSARTYLETSKGLHGPKLYLKGSDEFPYVNWIESELGFTGALTQEIISVTTFNTCIALMLGCNPIIYIGVDLAYTGNKSYSSGVEENTVEKSETEKESDFFEIKDHIWSKDIYGQPILTKEAWQVESRFLTDIMKMHPETQFINATEGGLGFQGAINMPLKEVQERFLATSYPFDEWIHCESIHHVVENSKSPQICKKLYKELKQSFKRVLKVYQETLKAITALQKKNKKQDLGPIDERFVHETQVKISNEIAYQYLLTHQHQIIDAENLKTHSLYFLLPPNASQSSKNEVLLKRLENRFKAYLHVGTSLLPILEKAIEEVSKL